MFIALIFIILGAVFLLKNLGLITTGSWSIVWPLILVLIGVYFLWKRYEWKRWREKIWKKLED